MARSAVGLTLLGASGAVKFLARPDRRAAGRLRGGDALALDAGAAALEHARFCHRRGPRNRRAALLCRMGQARAARRRRCRSAAPTAAPMRAAGAARRDRPVSRAGRLAMSVAIVDYGSGNLHSAAKAFERAARESGARSADRGHQRSGQGRARRSRGAAGRRRFRRLPARARRRSPAWSRRSTSAVRQNGRPFFGICVGMQLMAERGREYQVTPGLGWIAGEVDRIAPSDPALKIPHMGWNTLNMLQPHPLLARHPARAGRAARLFRALL